MRFEKGQSGNCLQRVQIDNRSEEDTRYFFLLVSLAAIGILIALFGGFFGGVAFFLSGQIFSSWHSSRIGGAASNRSVLDLSGSLPLLRRVDPTCRSGVPLLLQ